MSLDPLYYAFRPIILCLLTYVTENIQVADGPWGPRPEVACWLALVYWKKSLRQGS